MTLRDYNLFICHDYGLQNVYISTEILENYSIFVQWSFIMLARTWNWIGRIRSFLLRSLANLSLLHMLHMQGHSYCQLLSSAFLNAFFFTGNVSHARTLKLVLLPSKLVDASVVYCICSPCKDIQAANSTILFVHSRFCPYCTRCTCKDIQTAHWRISCSNSCPKFARKTRRPS